jgi:DNA-directed RNA polymerase subunit RPC12/RpoP
MKVGDIFTCPKCGSHILEEVMCGVIQTTVISDVEEMETGVACDYVEATPTYDEGEVTHYQCGHCGEIVAENETELAELLFPKEERNDGLHFKAFSARLQQGYYSGENGTAQFKEDVLTHYGWIEGHEELFGECVARYHPEEPGESDAVRLVSILEEFIRLI